MLGAGRPRQWEGVRITIHVTILVPFGTDEEHGMLAVAMGPVPRRSACV